MLAQNPEIGDSTSTVNPIVAECNDGDVSNIRKMAITEQDVDDAWQQLVIHSKKVQLAADVG